MNNKKEYDFLRELTAVDDEKISEIASKYPMPDKLALQRINALCEEKLAMKENVLNNIPKEMENVEVIRSIPWYRRTAFTAAACFVVLVGIAGGIMAVFSGKSDKDNIPDNPPLTIVETTTSESAETTTEELIIETTTEISAKTTLTKKNTKTTTAKESTETTTKKTKAETEEPIREEITEPEQPPETTETVAVITEPPTEPPTETYTEPPTEPPTKSPTEPPTEESVNDRILAMLKSGELPADADMNGVFDRTDIDMVLYYYAVSSLTPDHSYTESNKISEEVFNNIRDNFDYDNNGLVEAYEASLLLTYWQSLD